MALILNLLRAEPCVFNAILEKLNFVDLMNFMVSTPATASYIFGWGAKVLISRSNANAWPGHVDFQDGQQVTRWHEVQWARNNAAGAPIPNPIPALPRPLPAQIVMTNLNSVNRPIEWLIRHGHYNILTDLHTNGLWDPLGYEYNGESYLAHAVYHSDRPLRIADLIISLATNNADWRYAIKPYEVNDVRGNGTGATNLALPLSLQLKPHGYELWRRYWNAVTGPNINAATAIPQRYRGELAELIDRAMAESLRDNPGGGLNLAFFNGATTTVWHFAGANYNMDFTEFLHYHTPGSIDQVETIAGLTPVEHCYNFDSDNVAFIPQLLRLGADPGTIPVPEVYLRDLPNPRDKFLHRVLDDIPNPTTPAKISDIVPPYVGEGGSLLHYIIVGLEIKLYALSRNDRFTAAQKRTRRRTLIKRAQRLIALVRKGNSNGAPNPATLDRHNRTALQLAQSHGYHELYYALEVNPAGLARRHRYNLR
ncbi:uncharacterized protein DSM5745_09912 [Aspergillus mulundensis]|uniref:Uncharacterized protein n=1 Tax=Aspergillus mulundensis TaxID=1810919 RepID=A0A3D8QS38_9EURO|nr:hypothetical protein DSM5745_09912 [Aspergillus mulundensis]RDW64501.1 hypothetical protein DSM5745_09912 [Aspergillus mulundensis]